MSIFPQLLRPTLSARRAYSVFSKPGGGRYFNSAKPPKVASATTKGKVDSPSATSDVGSVKDQQSPQTSNASLTPEGSAFIEMALPSPLVTVHPAVNPQDLKLHQFFSLHRPLLLLSHPSSSLFEATSQSFALPPKPPAEPVSVAGIDGFSEPPEASPEEDADAARQLSRGLVMNRVAPSMLWEDTLQRLGLNVREGRAEEVSLAEKEFHVYMDSVKRKRRKKMKKHKLKKRRRLNRAQLRKTGR